MLKAPDHPEEKRRLAALEESGLLDTPPDPELDDIVAIAAKICDVPIALISLVAKNRQWFKSRIGLEATETSRDVAFCGHAILEDGIFEIPDATRDPRFSDSPLVTGAPGIQFYAGTPIRPHDGLPIGTLCVIDQKPRRLDADQRRCLLALVRQIEQILRLRAENRTISERNLRLRFYELTLRNMSDGVVLQSADGTIIEANEAACRTLGLAPNEILGRKSTDPNWKCAREDGSPFPGEEHPAMVALRTGTRVGKVTMKVALPGDEERWIQVNADPIFVPEGRTPSHVVCTFRDITEDRRNQRLVQESSRMMALGAMASGLAHEVNNPLAIIIGRSFGIRKKLEIDGRANAQLLADIDQIERTANRIAKIVKGLSAFSRQETGETAIPTSIHRLVSEVLELFHERFQELEIEIRLDLPPPDTKFVCRPVQIAQVLLNMIVNSRYAIRDQAERWISIFSRVEGDRVRFEVTDSGPGIPPEIAERIFDPFFTTKPVGQGTGLGLSISRGIVESHGGTIRIDRRSPNTRFELTFPAGGPPPSP